MTASVVVEIGRKRRGERTRLTGERITVGMGDVETDFGGRSGAEIVCYPLQLAENTRRI